MNLTTSKSAKIFAGVVGFAIALAFTVSVAKAEAAPMPPLTVGSSGAEVTALQTWLIGAGFNIPAGATGYFGAQTQAALAAFQTANMISPAVGYYGSITAAKVASMAGGTVGGSYPAGCTSSAGFSTTTGMSCAGTTSYPAGCTSSAGFSSTTGMSCAGGTTPTGPLSGTDGSISAVNELSQYASEEVGDGESDVKVLGFEVEASNDGDIALKSVKVSFDATGNTGSDNLDDYVDSVAVWMGSTKVGSADVEDFNEDSSGMFSKTITLNSGTVVEADATEKFYVSVDAVSNLDSGDIDGSADSWTIDIENIRFIDGSGVTTTEIGYDVDGMDVPIAFVSFSSAADTELKVSTDSANNPDAGSVIIDDSENTDGVELLAGKLELEGTADAVMDEFPVTFTTVGGSALASVANSITLTIDGEEYTESVASNCIAATGGAAAACSGMTTASITFDNLDFALEAGATIQFTVSADINDIDTGTLDEGDTLVASVSATNRNYMDVENSEGDQLSDTTEKSGTATGNSQDFRTSGVALELVDTDTDATVGTSTNDDVGLFTIQFKVTALGETVYIASAVANGVSYTVDKSGTTTTANSITATLVNNTDTDLTTTQGLWEIEEGSSETITLSVSVPLGVGGTSGQYRSSLTGVKWGTDSADAVPDNTYSSNLDSFRTAYAVLN